MFCNNCGSQIDDKAVVCPHCGVPVKANGGVQEEKRSNTIAIVGFVLSFFFALVGLICSVIGYKNAKNGAEHGGLALAGIIISAVEIGLIILLYIIIIAAIGAAAV